MRQGNTLIILTVVISITLILVAGGFYYFSRSAKPSPVQERPAPTPIPAKQKTKTWYFSASASAFIDRRVSETGVVKIEIAGVQYRSACEQSGGTWLELRNKDVPCVPMTCGEATANPNKIIQRGCSCNLKCRDTDDQFEYFNYMDNMYTKTLLPTTPVQAPDKDQTHLIFQDSLSKCSFLADKNNQCSPCQTDDECGMGSLGSSGWVSSVTRPVCIEGTCRFRRVIYSDF